MSKYPKEKFLKQRLIYLFDDEEKVLQSNQE